MNVLAEKEELTYCVSEIFFHLCLYQKYYFFQFFYT